MKCVICLSTNVTNVFPLQPGHHLHNTVCDVCKVKWVVQNKRNECPFCKRPWLHRFLYESLAAWETFYASLSHTFSWNNMVSFVHFSILFLGANVIVNYLFSLLFSGMWVHPMSPMRPMEPFDPYKIDELIRTLNTYLDRLMMNPDRLSQQCLNPHYIQK